MRASVPCRRRVRMDVGDHEKDGGRRAPGQKTGEAAIRASGVPCGWSVPVGVDALSAGVLVGVGALPAWVVRELEAGYRVPVGVGCRAGVRATVDAEKRTTRRADGDQDDNTA
ncbi:hypothetical protein B0H13DRAFT_1901399 [Mycena leptocephala]|nr:hypothetical protein B0H13DRAFT_1901399 [Mycena leptocephala]